jgi:hypothetical protein
MGLGHNTTVCTGWEIAAENGGTLYIDDLFWSTSIWSSWGYMLDTNARRIDEFNI